MDVKDGIPNTNGKMVRATLIGWNLLLLFYLDHFIHPLIPLLIQKIKLKLKLNYTTH